MNNIGQRAGEASLSIKSIAYYSETRWVCASGSMVKDCFHVNYLYEDKKCHSCDVKQGALRTLKKINILIDNLRSFKLAGRELAIVYKGKNWVKYALTEPLEKHLQKTV